MTAQERKPAGAAVRRPEITAAVLDAVLRELSEVGYGRLSVEGVARRAGVAKTAVYRRWSSKLEMVLELVSSVVGQRFTLPDTGSLRADLTIAVQLLVTIFRHPLAGMVVPDLLAEAARNPQIEQTLRAALHAYQQDTSTVLVSRAVARGELPADTDPELLVDLLVGPIYWRLVVMRSPVPGGYPAKLADRICRAVGAPTG
ncbi:MAG: TetR/AcrR family transcriptional regulator [Hamadaea sp.]|nr:TetR/AcrR family transcriptional regulator [Hamadaea sp.]